MSLRSDCSRASVGGQCPSRHDLAMCWSAPGESKRGPRQRRSALGDLAQLDADDRERASCKSAQAHSEGAGNPATESLRWRRGSCSSMAWAVRASRMSKRRPELVLRRSTTRGSPAQGRPWSFGYSPSGCGSRRHPAAQLRRGPSHLETVLDEVLDRIEDLRPRRAQLRQ